MSKQVLSIEQMQHLKELGVDTNKATFGLFPEQIDVTDDGFPIYAEEQCAIYERNDESDFNYPTFTLQDILDFLPKEIMPHTTPYSLYIDYQEMRVAYCFVDREGMCWLEPTFSIELIDAAYEMLCWVIENGYLKVK